MTWRTVVISERAKLEFRMNYIVIRKIDHTVKVFLDEISVLLVESTAVSLTTALLTELMKRKIKVIFCDYQRNPNSELISYYGSHDTSNKVKRQIGWSKSFQQILWAEIIREKINKQAKVLKKYNKKQSNLLDSYIKEVIPDDETNREGHAAKVYFNSLFGMKFTRTADNNINAALNYGYSIILSVVNREIVANGYITQLGLFHDNMFNQFNLGSDLMEPYRPLIDDYVYQMELDVFESDEKYQIVDLLNKSVYIDNKKQTVLNSIKIYCRSVFDALDQGDLSTVRFYRNEL